MNNLPFYQPGTVDYPVNTMPVLIKNNAIVRDTGTLPIRFDNRPTKVSIVSPPTVKISFSREGHLLHGKGFLVHNGTVELLNATVDLRPLYEIAKRRQQVSGIFGDIGKWVNKVGKSKIIRSISKGAKSVLKSKVVGGIVGAAAIVFPPVGLPAAAAYGAANIALSALEQGANAGSVAKGALSIVDKATGGKNSATIATINKGISLAEKARGPGSMSSVPSGAQVKDALVKKAQAKAFLTRVSVASKTPGPNQAEAKKFVKVISLVHRNRQNLKAISASKGKLGKLRNAPKVVVHRGKNDGLMKVYRTLLQTTKISGCKIGCEFC